MTCCTSVSNISSESVAGRDAARRAKRISCSLCVTASWWSSPSITTSASCAAESSSEKEERWPLPRHTLKRRERSRYSSVYAVPSDVARPAAYLAAMDCPVGPSAAASPSEGDLDRHWVARRPAAAAAAGGASFLANMVRRAPKFRVLLARWLLRVLLLGSWRKKRAKGRPARLTSRSRRHQGQVQRQGQKPSSVQ